MVVSVFFDGTALPMVTTIALCAVGAFILAWVTPKPNRQELAAEAAAAE